MIAQDAIAFLLLTLVGVGGALPTKGKPDVHDKKFGHEEITIYDASVSEPTRVPAKIEYVEGGTPVLTTTEKILVLPTPAKDTDKDRGKSKEKEVEADCPEGTAYKPAGPVPVIVGGENGGPVIPQGRPPALPTPPQPSSGSSESSGSSRPPPPSPEGKLPSSGSKRFGISYAPYRADHGCKSAGDIEDDFQQFAGDYSVVRIYGTDCDQVPNVYSSAKSMGVKVMLGIWDIHDVENEASKIVAGLGGDWDIVHSVSVGNELVNNGQANPAQVVKAVRQAREILRTNGYKGPVVTVDTFIATEKYPELCEESDYCAINAHPFFDSTMEAKDAGKWLANTIKQVQSKLSTSKHIVVTETGWPMDGAVNGLAVPGLENQKLAIESIKKTFSDNPGDIMLFSAFNDLWKERTMATFDADQFWGIGGAISRCDL